MALHRSWMVAMGLCTLLASCQVKPGEYRVYRVANEETMESNGCYPSPPGQDITGDSTTVRAGQTFAIYAADADTYFLDFEMISLVGIRDANEYSFHGETVDVSTQAGPTVTTTTIADVDVTIEGKTISGVSTVEITTNCSGMGCPDPANSVCTRTTEFQGSELKDVELQHGI